MAHRKYGPNIVNSRPSNRTAERKQMVLHQIAAHGIRDRAILAAFAEVPREIFVAKEMAEYAYDDRALPIASGQTISQPYVVARMIDAVRVGPADRVLEVGAGSGYAAAVLSRIVDRVYSIERHEALAREAKQRIDILEYNNCEIIFADGLNGLPDEAPFDAILVAARCDTVPDTLKRQLKIGGRLVIPVGDDQIQTLTSVTRNGENEWVVADIAPVRFVPLLEAVVIEE